MRKARWRRCCTCPTAPVKPDRGPHHSPAPRPPGGAGCVADAARGHGHPRAAHPVLGAGRGTVTGDRALVVPSALYLAEDGRVFVALGTPYLHDACGAPSLPGRGESPGRAGALGPYQPGHDATLHRGGHGGQAQTRRAHLIRSLPGALCIVAPQGPRPCHTPLCSRWALAGSEAAWTSSAACAHACCGRTSQGQRHTPREPGSAMGSATLARDDAHNPHIFVSCSPRASIFRRTVSLWSSRGEGGCMPATVRQTCASGTGFDCTSRNVGRVPGACGYSFETSP